MALNMAHERVRVFRGVELLKTIQIRSTRDLDETIDNNKPKMLIYK